MKGKTFIVAISTLIGTAGMLYLIGHLFKIPMLMFHYDYTSTSNGFFMNTGSLLPLVIGLAASFAAEKFYVFKMKKKLG
ncbi:hypothetical protein [Bacillus sp. FJAT-27445]|uniref:hypothetical protein n=1 Tax=Bacillus sp. FJAT-27445 TaxID=1679166 RepID=UPI000744417B|nr:hypothetical protein [Bacillus sp. FJAT-27445]